MKQMAKVEIRRLKGELRQQKEWDDHLGAQAKRCFKDKQEDFDKLYWDHKELEKEYDRQWERLKEAQEKVKDKAKSLMLQEKIFEETKVKMREEAKKEKDKLLEDHVQILGRSREVLTKVQTMYKTQLATYEVEATTMAQEIKLLKQEKHAMEEKTEMGIK